MSMTPDRINEIMVEHRSVYGEMDLYEYARAIEKKATRAALERAAQVAERVGWSVGVSEGFGTYMPGTSVHAARAIRALIEQEDAPAQQTPYGPGTNTGHGHVWPRPDGTRARCGGRGLCPQCSADFARYGQEDA